MVKIGTEPHFHKALPIRNERKDKRFLRLEIKNNSLPLLNSKYDKVKMNILNI